MKQHIARQLLETRLLTWADAQEIPVSVENSHFTPPSESDRLRNTYIEATLLTADTNTLDVEGVLQVDQGVFAMNIIGTLGVGRAHFDAIALGLFNLFPVNLQLTDVSADVGLQITTPLRVATGIKDTDRYTLPTRFAWRIDS